MFYVPFGWLEALPSYVCCAVVSLGLIYFPVHLRRVLPPLCTPFRALNIDSGGGGANRLKAVLDCE